MRFGAAFWVQRTGWPELRDAVLRAEVAGFDDLWIDDHLLSDEADWSDDKLEGTSTLAAIAAITTRPRLGHMVLANTLRNPGLIAKIATTIDHVSGGRFVLGMGSGWFDREHEAFGFDFGTGFGERLDRLGEAVPLVRRLLDGETVTHEGRFYAFRDAVCARGRSRRASRCSSAGRDRGRRCRWWRAMPTCGTRTARPMCSPRMTRGSAKPATPPAATSTRSSAR
jgi:alkanesulfonate monooxygenase SsuD/methylene tetrahydromethanopterin reductase-like flavin-dependent oxidoreductase (luciferase family)